jgi:hypothetical protein
MRTWRKRNRARTNANYKRGKDAYKARVRAFLFGYLSLNPCVDCEESDPVVLEFDHRDRSQKSFNIGMCTRSAKNLEKIAAEIAKCDVVCANCHRRRTSRQIAAAKADWGKSPIKTTAPVESLPLFRCAK